MVRGYGRWLAIVLGVVLLIGGCKKEPTGPDLSNPKAAAITFAKAMENGDIETAKASSIAGGMEVDLVAAMTKSTAALRKLGAACREKFGAAANVVMKETGSLDASAALANAAVDFDGEEAATVTPTEGRVVIPVRLVEGNWKVDIGALVKGDDITASVPLLNTLADAVTQITPDVQAGKYKDPGEVKVALQRKMIELIGRGLPTSVFPSSRPAATAPSAASAPSAP